MSGLPEDLIIEILLRLPVVALLRFRCVSKRWLDLIDSSYFVKSQLNLPNKPQSVMMVLFDRKLRFHCSEVDSDHIETPSPKFKDLTVQYDQIFAWVHDVVGHCHGLICFAIKNCRNFLLLNPSIWKHFEIETPELKEVRLIAWGFGYDKDSDDYRIVTQEYSHENRAGDKVWFYSLKSGFWKNIADFPYMLNHADAAFVNGALHWIVHRKGDDFNSSFIFSVHLGNLEYSVVAHPSGTSKSLSLRSVGVLDGNLYAIYAGYHENAHYDLWVMKEYGVKESWTRLSSYSGGFYDRELLFVTYGGSVVPCKFGSFRRKMWFMEPGMGDALGKPLVYEPSLVCPWSGI